MGDQSLPDSLTSPLKEVEFMVTSKKYETGRTSMDNDKNRPDLPANADEVMDPAHLTTERPYCDPVTGVCTIMAPADGSTPEGMYCDPETGVCTIMAPLPEEDELVEIRLEAAAKPYLMLYVTDPICSYCWQVEPELRKFMAHYGHVLDVRFVMGGLLPSWEGFADEGNNIRKASDVGEHWREAAAQYGMPIDGTVWDKDPIESSYPASIAFKLVQQISGTSAKRFLRSVREAVMVFNENVARDEVLTTILDRNDRNGKKVVEDIKTPEARELLEQDLVLSRQIGAFSFPTVILLDQAGNGVRIPGMQTFDTYEEALSSVAGEMPEAEPLPELKDMFDLSRNIFFKEIETMYELQPEEVEPFIRHNLSEDSYEIREILGSRYIIRK